MVVAHWVHSLLVCAPAEAGCCLVQAIEGHGKAVHASFRQGGSFLTRDACLFRHRCYDRHAAALLLTPGLLYGIANGVLVAVVRINPFITTVGTGFILNGIVLVMTQNAAFLVDNQDFGILGAGRWHGVPYSGMLLVVFMTVFALVLARTIYGEAIYAVGGNYEASRLSGLRVRTVVASSYVLLGGCVGVAGSITASQLSSAQANIDPLIIFDVLTIVVVGGTSLAGGSGAMWRTAIGLGIIATISNGFVLLDISPYYQDVIKGAIIVGALALDNGLLRLVRRGS